MTHSLHRQGAHADLANDFVVLGYPGREFEDLRATLKRFKEIGLRHQPVNYPAAKSLHSLVYDSKERVCDLLKDLIAADLGLSVTVSGLRDQILECCYDVGLTPHTINQSFGIWGKTEKLPDPSILNITTMCGHSRISPSLVKHLACEIKHQHLSTTEASRKMSQLCLCNIFNEARASKLLHKLVVDSEAERLLLSESFPERDILTRKDFGITIDEATCISCMECLPYCPVSAIVKSRDLVGIDPERCTECGVCMQSKVCPVDAIMAHELTWPRNLRGKFHNRYAPYRKAPTMAQTSSPFLDTEEDHIYTANKNRTELTSDVTGLYRRGEIDILVELGRPLLGTTFRDVQKVAQTLAPFGLQFPKLSPLSDVVTDVSRGTFRQDILDEKTGWIILGLTISQKTVPDVLQRLREVSAEIATVFALGMVFLVEKDGSMPVLKIASDSGAKPAINCKINVGLGRPLAEVRM